MYIYQETEIMLVTYVLSIRQCADNKQIVFIRVNSSVIDLSLFIITTILLLLLFSYRRCLMGPAWQIRYLRS